MIEESKTPESSETVQRIIEAIENPEDPRRLEAIARHRFRELRAKRNAALLTSVVIAAGALLLLRFFWPQHMGSQDQWAGLFIGVELGIGLCVSVADRFDTFCFAKHSATFIIYWLRKLDRCKTSLYIFPCSLSDSGACPELVSGYRDDNDPVIRGILLINLIHLFS